MSGLKLKLNTKSSNITPSPSVPQTPLVTPGGTKLKLKFASKPTKSSPGPTPAAASLPPPPPPVDVPKKTKAGRPSKPSAKVLESRKRIKDDTDEEDEIVVNVPNPAKKLKLNVSGIRPSAGPASATPKTPAGGVILKAKIKGKPPKRIPGEGYDSEASDREIDPHIEEQFILRMQAGDDCDYLRQAITDKKIGVPKALGGADVYMKFFEGNGRRAAINIRGRVYAATLVDLPCIIEGMKSWDKRGWWKSADICQMLLVFAPVKSEDEAKTVALPDVVDQTTHQYPHGLTPPMYHARKRVFRKRISKTTIEAVEEAVERLISADSAEDVLESSYQWFDPDRQGSLAFSPRATDNEYSEDEDAEGEEEEAEYFNGDHHGQAEADQEDDDADGDDIDMDDFAAQMEAELAGDEPDTQEVTSTATSNNVDTSAMATSETPLPIASEEAEGGGDVEDLFEDSGDESAEDEDDDEVNEKKQKQEQLSLAREDIRDLEAQLASQQKQLAAQSNNLLKKRLEDNIRKIKQELQLKKGAIEEEDGDA